MSLPRRFLCALPHGTAFTAPRADGKNLRTWLCSVKPSKSARALSRPAFPSDHLVADFTGPGHGNHGCCVTPNQLRWFPMEIPPPPRPTGHAPTDFTRGLNVLQCGLSATRADAPCTSTRLTRTWNDRAWPTRTVFAHRPAVGQLRVKTEMGTMRVPPGHVCVVPRGIDSQSGWRRGWQGGGSIGGVGRRVVRWRRRIWRGRGGGGGGGGGARGRR